MPETAAAPTSSTLALQLSRTRGTRGARLRRVQREAPRPPGQAAAFQGWEGEGCGG